MAAGNLIRMAQAYVQLSVKGSRQAEADLTSFKKSLVDFNRTLVRTGTVLVSFGSAALGGFAYAVKGASDLRESLNKNKEVFKENAKAMEEWSMQSATAFGLPRKAALEYAAQFGLILEKSGQASIAVASMSRDLVALAADLASFNNTSLEVALEKLKSGLVGESKPLRQFGILLSETEINARAAAAGYQKVNGEFSEGIKVATRFLEIQEQAGAATGDFTRTQDELANKLRQVGSSLQNLRDEIGTNLLPEAQKLAASVLGIVEGLRDWNRANPKATKAVAILSTSVTLLGGAMVALGAVSTPIIKSWGVLTSIAKGVGTAFLWVGRVLGPVFSAIRAATAFVGGLTVALGTLAAAGGFLIGDWLGGGRSARQSLAKEAERAIDLEKQRQKLLGRINKIDEENAKKRKAREIQKAADAQQAKVDEEEELKRKESAKKYFLDEIKSLKERNIELRYGKRALLDYQEIEMGLSQASRAKLNRRRDENELVEKQTKDQEKLKKDAEDYIELINDRVDALKLERIELQKGAEAAAYAKDLADGISKIDAKRLAAERKINKTLEEQNDLRDEAKRLAEDAKEDRRQELAARRESAAEAKKELDFRILGLRLGKEAESAARDKAAGFTKAERDALAKRRKELERLKALQDGAKTGLSQTSGKSLTGQFGGAFAGQRFGAATDPVTKEMKRQFLIEQRMMGAAAAERRKQERIANKKRDMANAALLSMARFDKAREVGTK